MVGQGERTAVEGEEARGVGDEREGGASDVLVVAVSVVVLVFVVIMLLLLLLGARLSFLLHRQGQNQRSSLPLQLQWGAHRLSSSSSRHGTLHYLAQRRQNLDFEHGRRGTCPAVALDDEVLVDGSDAPTRPFFKGGEQRGGHVLQGVYGVLVVAA